MSVSVESNRFLKYASWCPGTLVSSKEQFYIIVEHEKGSLWRAFGSKDGRTLLSDKDSDINTENVKCGVSKSQRKLS